MNEIQHKSKHYLKNAKYYKSCKGKFTSAKTAVKSRKLDWSIPFNIFEKLMEEPCSYCFGPLDDYGCSLDRVNNKLGYTVENSIPCCGECNQLKGDRLSHEETIILVNTLLKLRKNYNLWEEEKYSFDYYLALDTETGGVEQDHSLLSCSFIIYDKMGNVIDFLEILTKPNDKHYDIDPKALTINKIDLIDHDKVALSYKEAADTLLEFLTKNKIRLKSKFRVIAHNGAFDLLTINKHLLKKLILDKYISYHLLDTAIIGSFLQDVEILTIKSLSLTNLCKALGIAVNEDKTHSSYYDAELSAKSYFAMLKLLRALKHE